jgi:hypothetical protein
MHFFNNLGLMQWHYGQTTPLRYPPFGTYAPHTVPFPGGRWDYPTPYVAMGLNGIDTYHLGPGSFTVLADFYLRKFIANYLRRERDTTVYSEAADKDGWVRSDNVTGTGEVQVAKNGSQITKGIFSFNTAFIPDDKRIKKASLFIKDKTIQKKFPLSMVFPEFFQLDIVKGSFGNENIEASDYSAPASMADIACVAGNLRGNDYALRFDLNENALQYINKTGTTQFRLEIKDENFIRFYNGDTTELEGPYLDIYYDTASVTAVIDKKNITRDLQIYPNPAVNEITLSFGKDWQFKKTDIAVFDAKGVQVYSASYDKIPGLQIKMDIMDLASGSYFIKAECNDQISSGTFVKTE